MAALQGNEHFAQSPYKHQNVRPCSASTLLSLPDTFSLKRNRCRGARPHHPCRLEDGATKMLGWRTICVAPPFQAARGGAGCGLRDDYCSADGNLSGKEVWETALQSKRSVRFHVKHPF